MRKIGVVIAIAVLTAVLIPSPGEAFSLRVGPFYFHVPYFGYRHRHHHVAHSAGGRTANVGDDANLKDASAPEPDQGQDHPQGNGQDRGLTSALLYPALALPAVYDEIFWPPSSSWPFGYQAIFQTAFAKVPPDQTACPQPGSANAIVGRIKTEIRPTGAQLQQLQKLGGALGVANDYLAKTCPKDIPLQPVARLQLMEWQIEKLAEALDIVRQPLADFQQSLNDAQRARFMATMSAPSGALHADRARTLAPACAVTPTAITWSTEQISLSVQPTDAQRDAMANLTQAFRSAASELDANCPLSLPPDPLARLELTEARLDATWRALVSIQTALGNFAATLSDEQRVRFDQTDFASAQ